MSFSMAIFDSEAAKVRAYASRDLAQLPVSEFADLRAAISNAKRSFDAVVAAVAGEAARRSTAGLGRNGLAKQEGHKSPDGLIASDLGLSQGEATRLVKVGTAMSQADERERRQAEGLLEEEAADAPMAPTHPHVTAAVRRGELSIDQAAIIARSLDAMDPTDPNAGDLDSLEQRYVTRAPKLTLGQLRRMCRRQEAMRSPRDLERKERLMRGERFLSFGQDAMGMTTIFAKLDPASAAPIRTWIDAQVKAAMYRRRDNPDEDPRDAGQMRADALVMLAQHGLDCESPTSGVKTTVVVRVDKADLERGVGVAECDGLEDPISITTLKRMAVDAAVLPAMPGGESLPLDVGRRERYFTTAFTTAQRIALTERHGGCAWCHAPPSYCAAHHIEWWERDSGTSDLRNGVMLCVACHHNIHEADWSIAVRGSDVWFTPPRSVDPTRTPCIGGKAHLEALAA